MDFGLLSVVYLLAAIYTLYQLARGWRGLLAENPTPAARNLASLTALLILTPPAVYLHELGHAAAVLATENQLRGIGFFLYWGYTSYTGRPSAIETWIIAAAGPTVTLLLGWAAIAIGLTWRTRPAINQMIILFGILQLLQILVFYPLLTLANLGDLAGSDFAVLYSQATPLLAVLTGVVQGISLILLFFGSRWPTVRRRYARMTGGTGAPLPEAVPGSIAAEVAAGHLVALPDLDGPPADLTAIVAAARALIDDASPAAAERADAAFGADPRGVYLRQTLEAILNQGRGKSATTLYQQARTLLFSTHRLGSAKYALAILSLFNQPGDLAIFERFVRDPAFTRVAIGGLATAAGSVEAAGRQLLGELDGLAKVELVDLLLVNPSPELARRLVVGGLAPGYEGMSALAIARGAHLTKLLEARPDPAVVDGAGAILASLAHDAVHGGPDGTLDEYEDAVTAIERYLANTGDRGDLPQLLRLERFREYLAERPTFGAEQQLVLLDEVLGRLGSPDWAAVVDRALDGATTPAQRADALLAARAIGRRTPGELFDWLETAEPGEVADLLGALGEQIGEQDAGRYVALTVRLVGDREVSWQRAHALNVALEAAGRFPSAAVPLVEQALAGDVQARTKALAVLALWPADQRRPLLDRLAAVAESDPEPSVRARARDLVAG
ncbi:MAG: M50 family metallopeptidase [Dehalococcoidia bacterium]